MSTTTGTRPAGVAAAGRQSSPRSAPPLKGVSKGSAARPAGAGRSATTGAACPSGLTSSPWAGTSAWVTRPAASTSTVTSSPRIATFTRRPPPAAGVTWRVPSMRASLPGKSTFTGSGAAASGNHDAATA
jgi:hypothetical protein